MYVRLNCIIRIIIIFKKLGDQKSHLMAQCILRYTKSELKNKARNKINIKYRKFLSEIKHQKIEYFMKKKSVKYSIIFAFFKQYNF